MPDLDVSASKPIAFGDANSITLYEENADTPVNDKLKKLLTNYDSALKQQQILGARESKDEAKKAAECFFVLHYGKILSQLLIDANGREVKTVTYQQFLAATQADSSINKIELDLPVVHQMLYISRDEEKMKTIYQKVWDKVLGYITV